MRFCPTLCPATTPPQSVIYTHRPSSVLHSLAATPVIMRGSLVVSITGALICFAFTSLGCTAPDCDKTCPLHVANASGSFPLCPPQPAFLKRTLLSACDPFHCLMNLYRFLPCMIVPGPDTPAVMLLFPHQTELLRNVRPTGFFPAV